MGNKHGAKIFLNGAQTESATFQQSDVVSDVRLKGLIGEMEIRPGTQSHMSLGNFPPHRSPKGFCIKVDPDPEPDDLITQTTRLDHKDKYELILHIANYGNKTLTAEVWQM